MSVADRGRDGRSPAAVPAPAGWEPVAGGGGRGRGSAVGRCSARRRAAGGGNARRLAAGLPFGGLPGTVQQCARPTRLRSRPPTSWRSRSMRSGSRTAWTRSASRRPSRCCERAPPWRSARPPGCTPAWTSRTAGPRARRPERAGRAARPPSWWALVATSHPAARPDARGPCGASPATPGRTTTARCRRPSAPSPAG